MTFDENGMNLHRVKNLLTPKLKTIYGVKFPSICFPASHCHTQADEKTVKLVTGASQKEW